jgi:hypothetical protein
MWLAGMSARQSARLSSMACETLQSDVVRWMTDCGNLAASRMRACIRYKPCQFNECAKNQAE